MARILLTGSTGYIGRRMLDILLDSDHSVVCPVRDKRRFDYGDLSETDKARVSVMEVDFTRLESLEVLPKDIDAAYYLIHSMSTGGEDFSELEEKTAVNFVSYINTTTARQVIYLSGIVNDDKLSKHLGSRLKVEKLLQKAEKERSTGRNPSLSAAT